MIINTSRVIQHKRKGRYSSAGTESPILSLRPELKSGEQVCRLFNEVDVIRSKRPALPPDL
jgi:hypothetical protein